MTGNEGNSDSNGDHVPIPEDVQEMTLDELVDADYNVMPSGETREDPRRIDRGHRGYLPPDRVPNDDSIAASSPDGDRTDSGHDYIGYESEAATRIGDEATEQSERVERLREINEGRDRANGNYSVRAHQQDVRRIAEAICSGLPLARPEREKVERIVEQIDFERFGYHKGIQRVTLGVVAVVVDEHLRSKAETHDLVQWSDAFRETRDGIGVGMSDLETIKEIVREELDEGNVEIPYGRPHRRRDAALPSPTPPSERPDAYWDEQPAGYWARLAEDWSDVPDGLKEAIPAEYRERVDLLRRWAPWKDDEQEGGESEGLGGPDRPMSRSVDDLSGEERREVEEELEKLMEELNEERRTIDDD